MSVILAIPRIVLSFDEVRELARIDRGEDECLTAPSYRLLDAGLIRLDDLERPHITDLGREVLRVESAAACLPLIRE